MQLTLARGQVFKQLDGLKSRTFNYSPLFIVTLVDYLAVYNDGKLRVQNSARHDGFMMLNAAVMLHFFAFVGYMSP